MKKRILIVLACVALLVAVTVFTVQADTDVNAQIDFATTTTCPACNAENVNWQPLPQLTADTTLTNGGHYYVPAGGVSNGGYKYVTDADHKNACIHLNGNNITATGQNVFKWEYAGTLHIFGQGNVSSGNNTILANSAFIHLHGGTYGGNNAVYFNGDSTNVYVYDGATVNGALQLKSGRSLTVYGGTINSIYMQDTTSVEPTFSGNPTATVTIPAGKAITIGELGENAKLTINALGDFTINGDDATIAQYVADGKIVSGTAGETIGKSGDVYRSGHFLDCPHCPGTGLVEFSKITANITSVSTGHFYLTDSYAMTGGFLLDSSNSSPDFVLDLNGKVLTMNGRFMIRNGSKVSILDSGKSGTIKATGTDNGTACFAQMNEGTLNIYGGTIQEAETTNAYLSGLIVMEAGPATLNISGGNIIGGDLGTIYMKNPGTITMSGGTVSGGSSDKGGNVRIGAAGTFTMSGGTISGGIATNQGGNLYMSSGTFNMSGGTIENGKATAENSGEGKGGNMWIYSGATLSLTGGTVQNGTAKQGGNLFNQGDTITIGTNVSFNGGSATDGGSIYAAAGSVTNNGTITGGTATNGGSIYVAGGSVTNNGTVQTGSATYGGSVYVNAGTFNMEKGSVSGGSATERGGNVYLPGGIFNLNGGTLIGGTAKQGGNVAVSGGTLNINNGTLNGGTASNHGGALYASSGTVTMAGGTIENGKATAENSGQGYGGNMWIYSSATLTLTGGTVQNGEAVRGGNLFSQGDTITIGANVDFIGGEVTERGGSIYVSGGTVTNQGSVSDGHADGNGGNVAVGDAGKFTLSGSGKVTLGIASVNGGNIYISSGSATLSGGTVSNGTAAQGGNLWIYANCTATLSGSDISGGTAATGPSIYATSGGKIEMTDGSVTAATCDPVRGMAMYIAAGSTLNMTGGTIYSNPNVKDHGGVYLVDSTGTLSGNANIVTYGNDVEGAYGNGIAVWSTGSTATLTLDGNARVMGEEGQKNQNIYVAYYNEYPAKLIVKDTFTGEAGVDFAPAAFTPTYGLTIPATFGEAASGTAAYTGKLYAAAVAGTPKILGSGTSLVIAGTQVVKSATEADWYATNADAMAALAAGQYMKLYTEADLALTKDAYVDFNGRDVTVTGNFKLYGMDSANDGFEDYGFVTVSGPDVQSDVTNPINGNRYLYLDIGGDATFHRLAMRINKVSFRPGAAGIYYGAQFQCDDTLKDSVAEFGMVANVYTDSVIEADFKNQSYEVGGNKIYPNLYTVNSKDVLSGATAINGCIFSGIMKDSIENAAENKARAEMKIHGAAYISLLNADGTTTTYISDQVDYSLYDVLKLIDTEANYTANADKLAAFEEKFADELDLWSLDYIGKND